MRLEIRDLGVELRSREILKNVTLKLEEGEILSILGPNGSGKSTLLRTIFGILKPLKGVVLFDGKRLEFDDIAKIAAYLPQEIPQTRLRVIDIVLLGRTPHLSGIRRAKKEDYEIALNALNEVGLRGFEERIFDELSGGEKQKVMLARLFAQEPRVMLLDEPTAHLDLSSQIEVMRLIKRRVENGCSAIIAMHDINLAATFSDKILMLKNGEVHRAGKAEDVITPESVREVYGVDVAVRKIGKSVIVIPVAKSSKNGIRVHVICGGGSGAEIIQTLVEAGYRVSAGVLNVLDSDWEIATELGCEVVSEAPFSDISDENHEKNLKMVEEADFVILANLSIGRGNLKNLIAANLAAKLGKLIVVERSEIRSRNFAGEMAEKIYSEISSKSIIVKNESEILNAIRDLAGRPPKGRGFVN